MERSELDKDIYQYICPTIVHMIRIKEQILREIHAMIQIDA